MNCSSAIRDERSFADKVASAYGEPVPDWLQELARLADSEGLAGCEKKTSYSRTAISQVLNGKYGNGDLGRVEEMVRGALMTLSVNCPALGEIPRNVCLGWQAKPFSTASSHRVRMFQACRNCQHARNSNGGK